MDFSWLFNDNLSKGLPVNRIVEHEDIKKKDLEKTAYVHPEIEEYGKDDNSDIEFKNIGLSEDKDLAERAGNQLEEAVEHLETDQRIYNALTEIVKELDERRDNYREKHPIPGQEKEEDEIPDWVERLSQGQDQIIQAVYSNDKDALKVAQDILKRITDKNISTGNKIARIGKAPDPDKEVTEEQLHQKAKASGMSEEEIRQADLIIDRIFSQKPSGFQRKF